MFETIVALATPALKSALAIIRVSGDDCFDVVSKCFSKDIRNIKERTCLIGNIVDKNQTIDEVVINVYKGPKSFTGEDLVEIMCHGSMLIANQIIELLLSSGARYATNGEFSSRAFLHQKIDLIQAEAINDLINSTTNEAKNLSLLSLSGETSSLITPIREKLAYLVSLIEVNIDFPEYEDIEVANKQIVVDTCDETNTKIEKLINDGEKALIVKEGLKVAIVGKPNVGKSSLLNALIGEDKAIVTDIAGTTRDVVEGDVNLKGIVLHLLDTAGIRDARDKVESIGVNKSKESISKADLVIVVLDGSSTLDKEDETILDITKDSNRIIVYNKSDKTDKKDDGNLYISALNKDITPLVNEIYKRVGLTDEVFKTPSLNNVRQLGLLKNAYNSLRQAKEDSLKDLSIDLVDVSIIHAYNSILEILGENNQGDLSKEIFSHFCVGK